MSITTHVLDLASGKPAAGIAVILLRKKEGGEEDWRELGRGVTDADGRARDLLADGVRAEAGTYRLTFDTLSYFKANLSSSLSFFPEIVVTFSITDPARPHHVPLLLSPFGYSTYRGS